MMKLYFYDIQKFLNPLISAAPDRVFRSKGGGQKLMVLCVASVNAFFCALLGALELPRNNYIGPQYTIATQLIRIRSDLPV